MLRSIRAILIQSVASIAVLGTATASAAVPPPLPIEKTGIVKSLPKQYPADWFFVHEAGFFNMSDGKVYVIDTEGDTVGQQVKGSFNISYIGNIAQSPRRGEIYATETFHSRGTRGERIDVLTIWDHENLTPVAEVMLPSGKRFMGIPQRNAAMIVINEDRWLAIANFSPATSITLIDLDKREIINEVPTPGCSLVYPTGKRGFSSLCADGRFMSTSLKANGWSSFCRRLCPQPILCCCWRHRQWSATRRKKCSAARRAIINSLFTASSRRLSLARWE